MSRWRKRCRLHAWAPIVLVAALGCDTTQKKIDPPEVQDDFGAQLDRRPITAETVGETQMLHRRWQFSLKGGLSAPTGFFQDNGFEVGPSLGGKIALEMAKDLFFGISFDWSRWEQGDKVSRAGLALADTRPDQLYEEVDRYNFLLTADYDWTLARSFIVEKSPLVLTLGGGLGATVAQGNVDPFIEDQIKAAGGSISIVDFLGFLARVGVALRWQFHENVGIFGEVNYDFVAPFEMEIRLNRQRSTVDENIDFGSINLLGGFVIEF